MSLCPKDFKPCYDDVCHGAGCIRIPGSPAMYELCSGCGNYVSDDDHDDCTCDYDDDGTWDGVED